MEPTDEPESVLDSPLWPLLTVLAEIAERVARRQAEEHHNSDAERLPLDDAA